MTHHQIVLLCYMQQLEAFRQNAQLQSAVDQARTNMCEDVAEMAIQSSVPKELESIFRRGFEWESGVDLISLLQVVYELT